MNVLADTPMEDFADFWHYDNGPAVLLAVLLIGYWMLKLLAAGLRLLLRGRRRL